MKNVHLIILLTGLLAAFSGNRERVLHEAQKKINSSSYVQYRQRATYPNPMGTADTLLSSVTISTALPGTGEYDLKSISGDVEKVFLDQKFRLIEHNSKTIRFFTDPHKAREYMDQDRDIIYSPITLLRKNWIFASDTIMGESSYSHFSFVETDTVVNGNSIFTELHLFINSETYLPERFERRNYYKGDLSQKIVYEYSAYSLTKKPKQIEWHLPPGYTSEAFGSSKTRNLLTAGTQAAPFEVVDLEGNNIELEHFRGRKVLLVFSAVNCGYSQLAHEHLSQLDTGPDKELAILRFYPLDSKSNVKKYLQKFTGSSRVIPEAKNVADNYGVFAFPTFFLLDSEHIIEKVVPGFNRDFLNSLVSTER